MGLQVLNVRAVQLAKSLGYKSAAGFLRNRGVELEDALAILFPAKYAK